MAKSRAQPRTRTRTSRKRSYGRKTQNKGRRSHVKRTKSKRRRAVRHTNNNQMGGSPAYRMHQQEGFLNQINPHARNLPLSQPGTNVNKPIYQVSH